jgi:hypothetical protein
MKFKILQDNLRKILWDRIEAGELTGLRLAQQTGFKQAHISNFLNRKRGLSFEGIDKLLAVQHLSVLDLLDPADVNKRATILPPSSDEFENVLLTDPAAALQPLIHAIDVKEILKFKKSFLRKLKPETEGDRSGWQRFVLIKASAGEAAAMHPRLLPGAMVLLDRHYNSLKPYRKGEFNLYAVLKAGQDKDKDKEKEKNKECAIRYVEVAGQHLILRPHHYSASIEVQPIEEGMTSADYLIGRVCQISLEA